MPLGLKTFPQRRSRGKTVVIQFPGVSGAPPRFVLPAPGPQDPERLETIARARALAEIASGLVRLENNARIRETAAIEHALNLSPEENAQIDAAIADGYSPDTRRSYKKAWDDWSAWAALNSVPDMPAHPRALAAHVHFLHRQGLSIGSIRGRLSGIAARHKQLGFTIRRDEGRLVCLIRGLERMAPPAKHKKALTLDKVHAMI